MAIAETTIEAVDYREGTDPPHVRKLSGLTKYGNITLKYGISVGTGALDLFNWHKAVSDGFILEQRKRITIVVQDVPLRDPRVQQNEAYLTVIVLSRVIVRLGSLSDWVGSTRRRARTRSLCL